MSVASAQPPPQTSADSSRRLHHLDAVRAFAMLLGIVLHSALSYWSARRSGPSCEPAGRVGLFVGCTAHKVCVPGIVDWITDHSRAA